MLENVDRLLISPKEQKGRDFLIMLAVLNKHGYNVEWSVLNAADYGYVQRRKRVFIFAQKWNSKIDKVIDFSKNNETILTKNLKINKTEIINEKIINKINIQEISNRGKMNFYNYGYMIKGKIKTIKSKAIHNGKYTSFKNILEKNVDEKFYLNEDQKNRIFITKDGGKKFRTTTSGFTYTYSEGKMSRFDNLGNKPARTMLTSEGSINRSTHIVKEGTKYRFITPTEAEKLNGFDKNWTSSISSVNRRYFVMGNALVTNLVEEIGKSIKFWSTKK